MFKGNTNNGQIAEIYENVVASLRLFSAKPQIKIEFYPYVGINNKIRLLDNQIQVKLSDLLIDAPLNFHTALAEILVRRLFRKKIAAGTLQTYRNYIKLNEIREKSLESRKTRGRKLITSSTGEYYNLDEIFTLINQIYFNYTIPKPQLTWSPTKTFRVLGHHDSTHNTISISKSLDDIRVPRFVVEYVVYHEMLHIKHPAVIKNGRRYCHTPPFRRDELNFAFFDAAEKWIEANSATLRKRAKRTLPNK